MNIIKNAPRMSDGWYYPVGDKWWYKIKQNVLNCYAVSFDTPNKTMYIEIATNKTEIDDICNSIRNKLDELQNKSQIFYICNYGYMLRDECPNIRVIIIEIYAKR